MQPHAMDESFNELELPGFRFHPTEEELLSFYLRNMILGKKLYFDIIGFLNIYHYEPWDLPGLAKIGEREWYFFVPRDRKHGNGGRPNRTTKTGFWKATGSDRKIISLSDPKKIIGLRKTLVFYTGRAPRGSKTDWVMNEYRLPDTFSPPKDIVLCRIYRKATSLKVLEERAAMGLEEMKTTPLASQPSPPLTSPMDTISFSTYYEEYSGEPMAAQNMAAFNKDEEEQEQEDLVKVEGNEYKDADESKGNNTSLRLPLEKMKLPELQVPRLSMDWTQDTFWTQLRSPWLDNFMTPCANVLNF